MPDLITHTFLGMLLNKITPKTVQKFHLIFFFLIGNIAPDIFSRGPMVLFPEKTPFFSPFHTLMGGLIISYIIVLFFDVVWRKRMFCCIFAGSIFHLLADLVQKDLFGGGHKIFFPLDIEISIGFLWPEDSLYSIPFLFVLILFLYRKETIKIVKNCLK